MYISQYGETSLGNKFIFKLLITVAWKFNFINFEKSSRCSSKIYQPCSSAFCNYSSKAKALKIHDALHDAGWCVK